AGVDDLARPRPGLRAGGHRAVVVARRLVLGLVVGALGERDRRHDQRQPGEQREKTLHREILLWDSSRFLRGGRSGSGWPFLDSAVAASALVCDSPPRMLRGSHAHVTSRYLRSSGP